MYSNSKERNKIISADDMILLVENPNDFTKKPVRINELSKAPRYKKIIHRNQLHFYTHEQSEEEITKVISFTTASKRTKYLEINLTKEMKNLYNENYKTLLKKIQDDTNKWKHIPYS